MADGSPAPLMVWWGARLVGRLERNQDDRLLFHYEEAWSSAAGARPISISLPLNGPADAPAVASFFGNLLPEGDARAEIASRLGLSESNDFDLLRAIGGECAGALSLLAPGAVPSADPGEYEELDKKRLDELARPDAAGPPLLLGGPAARLSLAGAQRKVPVFVDESGLYLPMAHAPSTHILKVGHAHYKHLPENEALVMQLGREMGLEVPEVKLLRRRRGALLLVRRYDRVVGPESWMVERIHQEDMCQARGIRPGRKYEAEGGPGLVDCVGMIRDRTREPLRDTERLLGWAIFNWIAGNSDAHAKNVSILYDRPASPPRLAPFYDLVCTRAYPRLDRDLAMALGGRKDPGAIDAADLKHLAETLLIQPRWLLGLAADLAAAAAPALQRAVAAFRDQHGEQPVLQLVPPVIRRQIKRTQTLLRESSTRA